MMTSRLRIIVGGMVARCPLGGVAFDYLQYVLGLSRLGHDVYYHEDTWCWPYDPLQNTATADGSYSAAFLEGFFRQYAPELAGCWHYDHLRERSFGMSRQAFAEVASTADLFLNVSGVCTIPQELPARCVKVFLDTDPGYNQILLLERFVWSENVERWCSQVAAHDRHFTYAERFGADDCGIPSAGYEWQPTRMPIVTDLWSPLCDEPAGRDAPWTTVTTWDNFAGPLVYRGVEYKGKGAEFEKLLDLPSRVAPRLLVALGGETAPHERLAAHGWGVVDGPQATLTPQAYRNFLRDSRGEVSTAKNVYVALRSGWFSCRSACYLAGGRPVVLQDTGFSRVIPCGEGLLAFETVEQAAQMIETVEADYHRHSKAAAEIARQSFDSDAVLRDLIDRAFDSRSLTETR